MTKLKAAMFLIGGGILVYFAHENWHYPQPPVKIFGFAFLPLPQGLIIYCCLLLGFLAGWLAHGLRMRRRQRAAAAQALAEKEQGPAHQASQEDQDH